MHQPSSMPEFMGSRRYGNDYNCLHLRDEFALDDVQCLDAPLSLPSGSHRVINIHQTANPWFFTYGFRGSREDSSSTVCGPSDKTGAVPAVTAPTVPGPGDRIRQPLISVRFKCPEFGTNSEICSLHNWPMVRRSIGRKNIISAYLSGSLV